MIRTIPSVFYGYVYYLDMKSEAAPPTQNSVFFCSLLSNADSKLITSRKRVRVEQ